jgi:AcrR family transcriptional regulator
MADTTSGRTNKDARREEILDAAYAEFSEKSYSGASMEAIARRARCSKETLYAWFDDKKSLFQTLFATRLERVGGGAQAALEEDPRPENVLPVIARDTVNFTLAMAPLAQIAISASEQGQPITRSIDDNLAASRKVFVSYLKWCRTQGYIAFDDEPEEIASIFVAMAQGEWLLRLATGQVKEVTDAMIDAHAERVTALFLKALKPATK